MSEENKEQDGLLHHQHPAHPQNPYDPDAHHRAHPTQREIQEAAGESHHGLVRKADGRKLGREEEAKLALENTEITNAGAWVLTVLFLLTIFVPPIVQAVVEVRSQLAERAENPSTSSASKMPLPQFFEVFGELPSWEKIKNARTVDDAAGLLPDAERLKSHEKSLEDNSIWVQWMLPRAQYALTKYGGAGNEQAYLGLDGWLYYRPDVDYLTSPGFLDPAMVAKRKRGSADAADMVQPDPVRAIVDFRDQLKKRGIELIIMPMPVKPMIEAEHFHAALSPGTALQNSSYEAFVKQLGEAGIPVYDPTPVLRERKQRLNEPQFLQTDTHWNPPAMEAVAEDVAIFVRKHTKVRQGVTSYVRREQNIQNLGDTAVMLALDESQTLFPKQEVTVRQIQDAPGIPWQRRKGSDVLILGDSFCNVFSLTGMGWGQSAGFGEHLSYYLKQPLDSIVVNAGGSHTSRLKLVGEMARARKRGKDRLAGVKLVIWEFSMRDLVIGDWKILQLP